MSDRPGNQIADCVMSIAGSRTLAELGAACHHAAGTLTGTSAFGFYLMQHGRPSLIYSRNAPWGFRVMVREVFSPSPMLPVLVEKAVRPKAMAMRGLMAQVLGLPDTHPAVQRGVAFVVLPAIMLLVAPREGLDRVLPALAQDPQGLQEDLLRYVMAGLRALAAAHREAPQAKPVRRSTRRA